MGSSSKRKWIENASQSQHTYRMNETFQMNNVSVLIKKSTAGREEKCIREEGGSEQFLGEAFNLSYGW